MNAKRKAGGRARAGDSVVSRLLRRRTRERFARYGAAREWVRGEPRRAQQAILTARFRRAVTGLVVLAFAMGTLVSPYLIRRLQGDDRDAAAQPLSGG